MIAEIRASACLNAYLSGAAPRDSMPSHLALTMRERADLIRSNPDLLAGWNRDYDEWFPGADERYRCVVTQMQATAPLFRMSVKDTIDVAGVPTRLGLRRHRHYPSRSAAIFDQVLKNLEPTCKVVTTELNIGFGAGCFNPLYPTIDPSGSSTGSAVAVAASICDVSLGTDVLGSVRWPASHCGMVGLRMTHRIENLAGVFPLSPRMDALGWITRTVDDMDYMSRNLVNPNLFESRRNTNCNKVGIAKQAVGSLTSSEMLAMMGVVSRLVRSLNVDEVPSDISPVWQHRYDAWKLCARDAWLASESWIASFNDDLHWTTLSALEVGSKVSDDEYQAIHQSMDDTRFWADAFFDEEGIDFLLLPADPRRPFELSPPRPGASTIPHPSDPEYEQKIGYTPVASFAGLPALVMPIVLTADRAAPLCLQIIGRRNGERELIDFARRVETVRGPLIPLTEEVR